MIPDRTAWIDRCCKALDEFDERHLSTEQLAALTVVLEQLNSCRPGAVLRLV